MSVERHRQLRQIARILYMMPGTKPTARTLVRFVIQQSSLSLKNKQRLYNFFAKDTAPFKAIVCRTSVPSGRSITLKLDLQDDISRTWYYWGYAGYERATNRIFSMLLRSKSCVFDIGANIGYYTVMAASSIGEHGEVHAFEPFPEAFCYLSYNARLNDFKHLHLNQMAMSDADGKEQLFLPSDLAWSNASLLKGFVNQDKHIIVDTGRFDTYCAKNHIDSVDLVRIDVEGAEPRVLCGMGSLLDAWLPDIILEVLQPFENDLNNFFLDKPYHKFLITDDGLREMDRITAHPRFRDYYLSCAPIAL